MVSTIKHHIYSRKTLVITLYDFFIALITLPIAFCLRFSSFDPILSFDKTIFLTFLLAFTVKVTFFYFGKLQKGLWSFSSVSDLFLIIKVVSASELALIVLNFMILRLEGFPRSAIFIDWLLTIFLLGGGRLVHRLYKESLSSSTQGVPTILIGGGRAAAQIIHEIKASKKLGVRIRGILDDDPKKKGRSIHGITVLGNTKELDYWADYFKAKQVIIAVPSASAKFIRGIQKTASKLNLDVSTLPSMLDIVGGRVQVSQLRPVNVDDLLGRKVISLETLRIERLIHSSVVLVTGAGGSIGSELCRQIMVRKPSKLVLFESCEFFIYQIHLELKKSYPHIEIVPIVGNVRDSKRVQEVFSEYTPDVVFHAAAYKHVPMMEINEEEAFKTNVTGTSIVAEAAARNGCKKFIFISTDKAVRPTNIMGATKRIAEIKIQEFQLKYPNTNFGTVRFGNVLGSKGSAVPLFMEQIRSGGPVTVTHPEVTRYFMSISEATQLVLQAASMTDGGEIFILDMGHPVKILNLAEDLIRLCGFVPGRDVDIIFTGLRPGEKLYEELLTDEELTLGTSHPMVRVAKARPISGEMISKINDLNDESSSFEDFRSALKNIVPEYSETTYPELQN